MRLRLILILYQKIFQDSPKLTDLGFILAKARVEWGLARLGRQGGAVVKAEKTVKTEKAEKAEKTAPTAKSTPIRMLAVDDQSVTTSLVRASFRQLGVQVLLVSTQVQALAALASQGIDLVMVNLDFSSVDAAQLCRHMQHNKAWANIPVVVSSVQDDCREKQEALAAGASLFVQQPLPRSYLISHIKDLLEIASRAEERVQATSWGDVSLQLGDQSYHLPVSDISASGMLVGTTEAIPVSSECELEFFLPNIKKPLKASGTIVRVLSGSEPGLGVRFQQFHGDSHKRLLKYLASHVDQNHSQLLYYL